VIEKILVSSCLLGRRVRFDASVLSVWNRILEQWKTDGRIVPICPEVDAGMSIPRAPAEISGGSGRDVLEGSAFVMDKTGQDVTGYFMTGASLALALCEQHDIKIAILTESSPSCGSMTIYDGRFEGNKIVGAGVTAALLQEKGIRVFNQFSISAADEALQQLLR
jgi:uncharacterized protein YbbK (DUF523 family)